MIKRLKYKRYLMNCGYKMAQMPNGLFAKYNFKFHSSFFYVNLFNNFIIQFVQLRILTWFEYFNKRLGLKL